MKRPESLELVKMTLLDRMDEMILTGRHEMQRFMSGEDRQMLGAGLEEGDLSELHRHEHMSVRRLDAQRNMVAVIDVALSKLKEGSYGICEDCGSVISEERLRVMPHAVLCVECQEQREKRWFKRNG